MASLPSLVEGRVGGGLGKEQSQNDENTGYKPSGLITLIEIAYLLYCVDDVTK